LIFGSRPISDSHWDDIAAAKRPAVHARARGGGLEVRATDDTALVLAVSALPVLPALAPGGRTRPGRRHTQGTREARRLARLHQHLLALLLGSVAIH
jgi:hypothetical protein